MVWNLNNCKEHDRSHRILCSTKVKVVHFSDMRKQMFVFSQVMCLRLIIFLSKCLLISATHPCIERLQ